MEFLSTPDLNSSSRAWSALPTPSSAVHNNHSLHHQHINLSNTGNTPFASVKLDALTPLIPTPAPAPLTTGRPSASKQQQQQQQQYATTNNLNSKQCNSSHNINTNKSLTNKHPQQQQNASPCVQLMNTTPVGCTSPSPTTVPPLDRAGIKTSFQSLFSPNPNGSMTSSALPLNHFPSSSPPPPLHPHYTSKPLLTSVTPAIHQTPHGGSQPIGLTPFLQGVATPSLVAPNTTFFASDGSRMNPLSRPVRQNEVVLNSPFLQAAAKEAVRREFLNMPTYVTPQDHHGSPSNNQNQNQNDHSQNVSPHSTTSNHNEKEQQHRQKMSEEDDVSEGERTVPKSNVQNNSASPVNSNCHQSSLKTVSENQAENTKTVESISNETDNSSQGDAKVPTSQLPTQQHQPQPQQQQPPQTQQQPATAPPFHTYFMPQPQQPHGMVVMGPHGPMLVHPHAAPHPHAALYGHPQGMMMFPGGQHYVHPPHAHVGHPGVMMPHPYAVHPAQYHASHQQQQVAAQHAQQQQQQNMNQEGNNSNEQRMNNSEQLNAQKCEVQLEKQAKERNNASEQHEQQNHQSIAAIATGTQNEERGSPTTVTTNTMSGTSSGAIGQSPEKTNIETCNSNEGLNHNLQNISSIGGAIGLTNISPGNALKRKLEVQQETAAEKKARIEIEKQELIREFKKKTREAALVRFRQKRSERRFGKLIRYDCRKKLADARPRVKGRFVRIKAGELAEDESESAQVVPEMDDS